MTEIRKICLNTAENVDQVWFVCLCWNAALPLIGWSFRQYLRLDRLFLLLESGTSAATRRAAALQIGEIAKLHPHDLEALLTRVSVDVTHGDWDVVVSNPAAQ
jgi:hypothetical protein